MGFSLRGKDVWETAENWSILFIFIGAAMLSAGIGLTIVSPRGIPAALAMAGALISFGGTVALIFTWLAKELRGE
jgi:hypothetical protein